MLALAPFFCGGGRGYASLCALRANREPARRRQGARPGLLRRVGICCDRWCAAGARTLCTRSAAPPATPAYLDAARCRRCRAEIVLLGKGGHHAGHPSPGRHRRAARFRSLRAQLGRTCEQRQNARGFPRTGAPAGRQAPPPGTRRAPRRRGGRGLQANGGLLQWVCGGVRTRERTMRTASASPPPPPAAPGNQHKRSYNLGVPTGELKRSTPGSWGGAGRRRPPLCSGEVKG